VIASGTTANQESVFAPLGEIAERAGALRPPALVVIGDVVRVAAFLSPASSRIAVA
jgi:siroheme synthase